MTVICRKSIITTLLALVFSVSGLMSSTPASADFIRVKGSVVNVRQGPGTTYPVLFQADQGEEFGLKKTEGLWCLVDLGNGKEAWVFARLVEVLPGEKASGTVSDPMPEPEDPGTGLMGKLVGKIFYFTLILAAIFVFWKRRRILDYAQRKLKEASGYRREQPFRYDNKNPKDDRWEL